MEFDKQKFAKRLKELRLAKGLTQEELGFRVGIEASNYSNIETGRTTPNIKSLCKIMTALEISPNEVFDYSHFEDEKELDNIVLGIYNGFDFSKKQAVYKILRFLEDLSD